MLVDGNPSGRSAINFIKASMRRAGLQVRLFEGALILVGIAECSGCTYRITEWVLVGRAAGPCDSGGRNSPCRPQCSLGPYRMT